LINVSVSAEKASQPILIPPEPAPVQCEKCMCVHHRGEPRCPFCGARPPRPKFRDFAESDAWIQQECRDILALERWKTWDRRQKLKTVPPSHPRYAAWMALRCYLMDQCYLRQSDSDLVAHVAAVIILGVERREDCWWFGDLLMDEELGDDLYAPAYDDSDKGMASALMSMAALLNSEIGSRDDILPGDHAVIVGAFE